MRLIPLAALSALLLTGSCRSDSTSDAPLLLDVDSLLAEGLKDVAQIRKTTWLDADSALAEYAVTEAAQEAEVFSMLREVNKPVLRERYSDVTGPDPQSNLRLRTLTGLDSGASVRMMRIFLHPDRNVIMRLEADIRKSNLLFRKHERISLEYDPDGSRIILSELSGFQKVAWLQADAYRMRARYIYP